MSTASLPERRKIPAEQTWDLTCLFATPAAWSEACADLDAQLPTMAAFRGRLGEGADVVGKAIELRVSLLSELAAIRLYASNEEAVDTRDQAAAARVGQAADLGARVVAAVSFVVPELLAVGLDQIDAWVAATPHLTYLRRYTMLLRRQQSHILTAEVESVLARFSVVHQAPVAIYGKLANADMVFRPAVASDGVTREVTNATIDTLLADADPVLRRSAWESQADGYMATRHALAETVIATVKTHAAVAKVRGYPSSLHAALVPKNVPVDVYHTMLDAFRSHLPVWHRYWRLRKRLNGGHLAVCDIKASLARTRPRVPYRQAVDWICAGMAPLGAEYVATMRRGCLEERWVDYACNQGKRKGAFSSSSVRGHPLILMSYTDDVASMSTLAHELGHAMHSHLMRGAQPPIYASYTLFLAEIASTFNQAMVRDHLLRSELDRDLQIAVLEEAMGNFHRYLFLMPTLARFEHEVHARAERGAPLNADVLSDLTVDLFAEGYGGEVDLDRARVGTTWAHLGQVLSNFYVNDYATGIAAGHALVGPILSGDATATARYLDVLRVGGSRDEIDMLRTAGVDLTSPEPIAAAFAVLDGHIDRLERLLVTDASTAASTS